MIESVKAVGYLAGPMTGMPQYNFPAFDEAAAKLRSVGWEIISPAELDRKGGFDPTEKHTPEYLQVFVRTAKARNKGMMARCNHIILLPGWDKSDGTKEELVWARELGMRVLLYVEALGYWGVPVIKGTIIPPPRQESLLETAQRLTTQDRRDEYGHPMDDFTRIARMWSAIFNQDITPEQVGLAMICLKVGRLCHSPEHRDSIIDIAGYANCIGMIQDKRKEATL